MNIDLKFYLDSKKWNSNPFISQFFHIITFISLLPSCMHHYACIEWKSKFQNLRGGLGPVPKFKGNCYKLWENRAKKYLFWAFYIKITILSWLLSTLCPSEAKLKLSNFVSGPILGPKIWTNLKIAYFHGPLKVGEGTFG